MEQNSLKILFSPQVFEIMSNPSPASPALSPVLQRDVNFSFTFQLIWPLYCAIFYYKPTNQPINMPYLQTSWVGYPGFYIHLAYFLAQYLVDSSYLDYFCTERQPTATFLIYRLGSAVLCQ